MTSLFQLDDCQTVVLTGTPFFFKNQELQMRGRANEVVMIFGVTTAEYKDWKTQLTNIDGQ